jgi:UDP-GlcNAc:undecaprenyl-phosphate GlcNAc-1-phosphate transferase
MATYFLAFLTAAVLSYLLTPLVRQYAKWAGIYDLPSERKVHRDPVPLLGGFAIFLAFNVTGILMIIFHRRLMGDALLSRWQPLLICEIIILGLGVFDDILHLEPGVKFLIQLAVGILMVVFGFGIDSIANPVTGRIINLGLFSIPITIGWLVLVTNALNLVDGLDGLAAGTSLIAAATIFAVSFFNDNTGVCVAAAALGGSILGFLRHNFFPAKIFLGDSGSLLLGFLLAILSVRGSSKGATLAAMFAPILALGLPIMETLLSMIRRFLKSVHLIEYNTKNGSYRAVSLRRASIFKADKDHVHHRLLKMGFSQRKAVMILYAVCIALSVLAILTTALSNINIIVFLAAVLLASFIGIRSLRYQEFKILESGLLIPLFSFPVINRRIFQGFFDLAMISLSSYLSFVLLFRGFDAQVRGLFVESLPLILLVKIIVFYLTGIYRKTWAYSSLEEVLSIVGTVFLSSLTCALACALFSGVAALGGPVFFVLDFYLLLTLAGGFRLSYRVLMSYYRKGNLSNGRNVLIYGAGHRGSTILKEIQHGGNYPAVPVGFIDDDPAKKGRLLHGCRILGSLGDLDEILADHDVSEIVVSTAKIAKDKMKRLSDFCQTRHIPLRQFEFRFYEFS